MTKAFKQGHAAFKQGVNIINNPYRMNTQSFRDWVKGWRSAERLDNMRKSIDET